MKKVERVYDGSIRDVIKVAFPLVLASLSHALNLFIDRVMLTHYSEVTMAAAFPAGLTSFSLSCFFLGLVGYTGSFVAQYVGAERYHRVGTAVWQGIYFALIGGIFMAGAGLFAGELFRWFGHAPELQAQEIPYFKMLSFAGAIPLLLSALASFWGGRGKTMMIMFVDILIVCCNVPLNYLMIFGYRCQIVPGLVIEIPEMGIIGAGLGTVCATFIGLTVYGCGFFCKRSRQKYGTCGRFFDRQLFFRMFKYGTPTGIRLFFDLAAFNLFIIVIGKIDWVALAASGIAFATNSLAFTPMMGLGQAASVLTGQAVGARDIPRAERSVGNALKLLLIYAMAMILFFVFCQNVIFAIFSLQAGVVMDTARYMLYFLAGYVLFDGMMILFSSAVCGAGDTAFTMAASVFVACFLFAFPCAAAYWYFNSAYGMEQFGEKAGIYCLWSMWSICLFSVICNGMIFLFRYLGGKWKSMRVIEEN